MRAGRQIRFERALAVAYAKPCAGCGHPEGEHRELRPTYELVGGAITEVQHPEYKPLHFHCTREGCTCVLDRTSR